MRPPQPIDNYTDSDDDDTVVIGTPRPPTPPRASTSLKIAKKDVSLTIDRTLPKTEDESTTFSNNDFACYCSMISWLVVDACLSCTKLIRIC